MQSMTLSMTSTRFEATAYSSKRGSSNREAASAPAYQTGNKAGSRYVSSGSAFILDIAGLKEGAQSFASYLNSETSQNESLNYQGFKMKIQSVTIEAFSEQNREHARISEGFRFSYTSIEISMEQSSSAEEPSDLYDSYFGDEAYWGAEKTSGRIMDFIKSIAGGDPERLEQAKNGAVKGYKSVESQLGQMPQVCVDTLELLMEKIDVYKEEITAAVQQPVDLTA
ncbi:hypothetical protein EP073_07175 [Geovibrio thiophilus]|uniref:DUF5610 domain-containing protein n=1 Tax=Geovibrio thiophilus TaxID=139438 RepID=A0A3R5X2U7_9BACT|nr:hypothetical protein [Geovibrio thiophilus]QAR33190.1 hypothetical protein EP073_07175 [Geovibrio thiophilus]